MFSRAVGREGHYRQMSLARVGSTRSVPATLGLAPLVVCAFPVYTAQFQAALQGVGPELGALPRPKPLRFRFSGMPQRRRLGWPVFCAFPDGAAQAARSLMSTLSRGAGRLIPSAGPASVSGRADLVHLVSLLGT